ncbi:MAG: hypothetical protein LUD77_09345 [Clostridiales bacterium]|nr:hypothetical protein [Clostridiales bacterium]
MWSYNYTFTYSYFPTLCHHGIKGQKWGVRNGPPYPLKKNENKVENSKKSDIIKKTVSGHFTIPRESTPNSITDCVSNKTGKIEKRIYYDENGLMARAIHTTDHGNRKMHPYGKNGEHAHDYSWGKNDGRLYDERRELISEERKENEDIL